jgi:hypothetical protein
MMCIFGCPKPFVGHIGVIQRNAIGSWSRLTPRCQIVLLGGEQGTDRVAEEFGAAHIPCVGKNASGTPTIGSLFAEAQSVSKFPWMCYCNCDIILLNDLLQALQKVWTVMTSTMVVGRRWDLDVREAIPTCPGWDRNLRERVWRHGSRHAHTGIDFMVFPRGSLGELPAMTVGRGGWDNWMLHHAKSVGLTLVDVSEVVLAVHQNHDYSHHPGGRRGVSDGAEAQTNVKMAGGTTRLLTLLDADLVLTPAGRMETRRSAYAIYRALVNSSESNWCARVLLGAIRGVRRLRR